LTKAHQPVIKTPPIISNVTQIATTTGGQTPQKNDLKKVVQQPRRPCIPEDSTLKRHYLTHVRALIKAKYPPCPTDSTLKRHYQALIETEMKRYVSKHYHIA
jgi:hypothetical protein